MLPFYSPGKRKGDSPMGSKQFFLCLLERFFKNRHICIIRNVRVKVTQCFTSRSWLVCHARLSHVPSLSQPGPTVTCHVFPLNSSAHSFPCQQNQDDFQALKQTIRETSSGKRPKHHTRFSHTSIDTKFVQFVFHMYFPTAVCLIWVFSQGFTISARWLSHPKNVWPTTLIPSQLL